MWAYNETFYQIYPIGFCGAPVHNDGVTEHRILKIGEWAEYLGDLGIGSIRFSNQTTMGMTQEISARSTVVLERTKTLKKSVKSCMITM